MGKQFSDQVENIENIEGKEEIAHYEQFLLFSEFNLPFICNSCSG